MKKKIIAFTILFTVTVISSCSNTATKYYFDCNKQNPEIIKNSIPKVLFDMQYTVVQNTTEKSNENSILFVGNKQIVSQNKGEAIETEYLQMRIEFLFDSAQSEITQFYVIERNNSSKITPLSKEQAKKYADDLINFREKMLFYCNPEFKGR